MNLTEDQQLDLMHLRALFYSRLGQLLRERRELLCKIDQDSDDSPWTQATAPEYADIAKQLRANGLAEYRTYMQFASTFFKGVRAADHFSSDLHAHAIDHLCHQPRRNLICTFAS